MGVDLRHRERGEGGQGTDCQERGVAERSEITRDAVVEEELLSCAVIRRKQSASHPPRTVVTPASHEPRRHCQYEEVDATRPGGRASGQPEEETDTEEEPDLQGIGDR